MRRAAGRACPRLTVPRQPRDGADCVLVRRTGKGRRGESEGGWASAAGAGAGEGHVQSRPALQASSSPATPRRAAKPRCGSSGWPQRLLLLKAAWAGVPAGEGFSQPPDTPVPWPSRSASPCWLGRGCPQRGTKARASRGCPPGHSSSSQTLTVRSAGWRRPAGTVIKYLRATALCSRHHRLLGSVPPRRGSVTCLSPGKRVYDYLSRYTR